MEMLIVVAIVAVLAGAGYNYYADILPEARENTARTNLKIVRDAISRYFKDNMAYPTSFRALEGPYLQQTVKESLLNVLNASAAVLVEVPDSAKTTETNIFQVPPASCTWLKYDFDGPGVGNNQIRNIKIKINDTEMPW